MTDFEFGPVELVLAAFEGETPNPGVIDAIGELVAAGTLRLLDLVFVSRSEAGDLTTIEIEDDADAFGLGHLELLASGIAGADDLEQLSADLPPGTSALLIVVELTWARDLASRLADAGGFVVASERIPAPAVNAVVAEASAI